jgi:hypothetical protein
VANLKNQINIGDQLRQQLTTATQAIDANKLALDKLGLSTGTLATNAGNVAKNVQTSTTNLTTEVTALNSNATAANAAAAAQERLNRAKAGSRGGGAATGTATTPSQGGAIYRAAGGPVNPALFKPRGTDTIPAMLSPGEFVMNSKSTRMFFSQLVAMNAGRQPVYRANGGPVTNINIGDVNVNSQGRNGQVVGRDIGRALERELRKNTLSLRKGR